MSEMNKSFEFKVVFQKEVYFIPVVGVVMCSACGFGIIMMIVGFVFHNQLSGSAEFMTGLIFAGGIMCGVWWIVHHIRIEQGRKLVIDGDGITYHKFAGDTRLIKWNDIKKVTEFEHDVEDGPDYSLKLDLNWGKFKIHLGDFHDYDSIKFIIINRLPEISTTQTSASGHRVTNADVQKALTEWGFGDRAQHLIEDRSKK